MFQNQTLCGVRQQPAVNLEMASSGVPARTEGIAVRRAIPAKDVSFQQSARTKRPDPYKASKSELLPGLSK